MNKIGNITGAEFKSACANAIRGLGSSNPVRYRGISGEVVFKDFNVTFKGTGAYTRFVRKREKGKWIFTGVIVLPYIGDNSLIESPLANATIGFLIHELLHVLLTSFKEFKDIPKVVENTITDEQAKNLPENVTARMVGKWISGIGNGACDVRIEWTNRKETMYIGAIPSLCGLTARYVERGEKEGKYDPLQYGNASWTVKVLGLTEIAGYPLPHAFNYRKRLAHDPVLERAIDQSLEAIRTSDFDLHGADLFKKLVEIWIPLATHLPPRPYDEDGYPVPPRPDSDGEEGDGDGEEVEGDPDPYGDKNNNDDGCPDLNEDEDFDADPKDENEDGNEDRTNGDEDGEDGDGEDGDKEDGEDGEGDSDSDGDEDGKDGDGDSSSDSEGEEGEGDPNPDQPKSNESGRSQEKFNLDEILDDMDKLVNPRIEEDINEAESHAVDEGVNSPRAFEELALDVVELL
jgi:hypothetical protein